ncbi:MAG: DinB family protein [Blastocatellia bacterium]
MSLEELLDFWKEVRAGIIAELVQIPAEQFGFQATPESRSVAGIIRHIVEVQKFSTDELCRPDTDFKRLPIREMVARDAAVSYSGGDKEELIGSLRSTMESAEAALRAFGEEALREKVQFGKTMSKLGILYLYITHEMYHRGQITVYERLMQIEPAATAKVRELLAANE